MINGHYINAQPINGLLSAYAPGEGEYPWEDFDPECAEQLLRLCDGDLLAKTCEPGWFVIEPQTCELVVACEGAVYVKSCEAGWLIVDPEVCELVVACDGTVYIKGCEPTWFKSI